MSSTTSVKLFKYRCFAIIIIIMNKNINIRPRCAMGRILDLNGAIYTIETSIILTLVNL